MAKPAGAAAVQSVIILGSGIAGLTAAVYTARGGLRPLVVEGGEPGGQLSLTSVVENFPGFPDGIGGLDLVQNIRRQAERFGARYESAEVSHVDLHSRPFRIELDGERTLQSHSLIIATGARARLLGLDGEDEILGRGLSTCATCDGAFFKNRTVAVVGGGDSAMEDAIYLTRFAAKVHVVHRRDRLRASRIMQDRALANERIAFRWNTVVTAVHGEGSVGHLALRDTVTDETSTLDVDGLFVSIGHEPNTAVFAGQLELEDNGYIRTFGGTRTSVEGVFACGDVQDHVYRQAITAAGSGCMAAIDVERWLEAKDA